MRKLLWILAFLPISLSAAEYKWQGTGDFHSLAFGKHDGVPVTVEVKITPEKFDSKDCWQLSPSFTSCSMHSFSIQNGHELWREGQKVGSLSQDPLLMGIAYSTRGVEIAVHFAESSQQTLDFTYAFDYPTGDYIHTYVKNLPRVKNLE